MIEVQVSIRSVGICGSDVSYWQSGRIGQYVVKGPMNMGHEPSGVVTKLGEGVTHLSVGDAVTIEPSKPCGRCHYCKKGAYNVCENLTYLATPPTDGALARFFCHPASFVYKLPSNMSFDEGALVQPLALGFHACERGRVGVGHYVLVTGAGPLGMASVLAAKACGAAKICVTGHQALQDVLQERLDYIQKIGADVTIKVEDETAEETAQRIVKAIGREVDATIECSGYGTSSAVYATRPKGTIVQAGFGKATMEIPLVQISTKELDLRGMVRLVNNYETAIAAIASGKVNVKQLITHRFTLENALEAYNTALRREGVKVVIDCEKDTDSF